MKYLEKVLGDPAEEHATLLAKQKKERLQRGVSIQELDEHKQSFLSHQRDFEDHRSQVKNQQVEKTVSSQGEIVRNRSRAM